MSEVNVAVRTIGTLADALSGAGGLRGGANNQVAHLLGYSAAQDGGEGAAYWDAVSTATEDGVTIWGAGAAGRWLRIDSASAASSSYLTVADIAARNAIPGAARSAGMIVWVGDSYQSFRLGAGLTDADWIELEPKIIRMWEQPGFHPGNLSADSSAGWDTLFADVTKVGPGTVILAGPEQYSFWSPKVLDTASRASLYGFRILGQNATQAGSPIAATMFRASFGSNPNHAFITWAVTQSSLEKVALIADNGTCKSLIRFGRVSPTILGTALSAIDGDYEGEIVRVSGWTTPGDAGAGHAAWSAASTATEDGLDVWGTGAPGRWLRTDTEVLLADIAKSWCRFVDVSFASGGSGQQWAFEFDDLLGGANLENCTFENCRFDVNACSQGAVNFGYYGQPYSTIFRGCSMFGGNNAVPHGTGLNVDNFSTGVWCYGCDFQQLETAIRMTRSANVTVVGGQFETVQHIASLENISGIGANVYIQGARINVETCTAASDGPIVRPVGGDAFARIAGMGTLTLSQCNIGGLGLGEDYGITLAQYGKIVLRDCSLPGADLIRTITSNPPLTGAGVWTESCVVRSATVEGAIAPMPDYRGRLNPDGFVTLAGAQTSRAFTFTQLEPDAGYQIELAFRSASGGAASGSTIGRVTAQTAAGFTITVDAAPGAGESSTFGFRVLPAYPVTVAAAALGGLAYRWDAALGVTGSAPVTEWVDQVAGASLVLSAGAPALTASNANVNGLPTIDLAPGDELESDDAPSVWAFLNDANGDDGYTVIEVSYVPTGGDGSSLHFGTKKTFSNNDTGLGIYFQQTSLGVVSARYSDGATTSSWGAVSAVGLGYYAVRVRTRAGGVGRAAVISNDDEELPSADPDFTATAGAPAETLAVRGDLAAHTHSVAEILMYDRALPSHELRALIETYIRPKYGEL